MSFNFLAQKRIVKDIKNYYQSDINSVGIYCNIDESNIQNIKAMIIGPPNTPYENGFYFFDIDFPNDYPFSPPKVKFLTYEAGIRFNPNLYTNGKVCLSILGTWSGPGWTTCLNLNTVLLSIQSLLNENPLVNEPGFENEKGAKAQNYSNVVSYANIKTASIKMIEIPPSGFEGFKDIMIKHFIGHIDFYKKYIEDNKEKHASNLNSAIYNMTTFCDIDYLETRIKFIYDKYGHVNMAEANSDAAAEANSAAAAGANSAGANSAGANSTGSPSNSSSKEKKKYVRKSPNDLAKNYDIGFTKVSENDGKTYKVVEVSGEKRTMKRWVLQKQNTF
jgi:ubiquitin-conjugating enzyme E2 Z